MVESFERFKVYKHENMIDAAFVVLGSNEEVGGTYLYVSWLFKRVDEQNNEYYIRSGFSDDFLVKHDDKAYYRKVGAAT